MDSLRVAAKVISYVLPIDDSKELSKDLQNDELVKREMSSLAGLLVLKGGRFVELTCATFQVVKNAC